MKITNIRVRKLVSGPGYNHHAAEVEARLEDGDEPNDVHEQLSGFVDAKIRNAAEIDTLRDLRDHLRSEVKDLEVARDRLKREVERNRAAIKSHEKIAELAEKAGLDVPEHLAECMIPF